MSHKLENLNYDGGGGGGGGLLKNEEYLCAYKQ